MEININVFQKTIEFVVSLGYSVIQVFPLSDENAYYFLVHKFTTAQRTSTDDIQFNQLIGINITDLIRNNAAVDNRIFEHKLNEYLTAAQVIRMEFPNNVRWFKFASAK